MVFEDNKKRNAEDVEASGMSLVDSDNLTPKFVGEIHDTVRFLKDGEYELADGIVVNALAGETYDMPVAFNIVVDECSRLIAALMKTHTGYTGIKFWEVGAGQSAWSDATPPKPNLTDKTLNNPTFRKAVKAGDISFIDANSVVTSAVTNRIQVVVTFSSTEANGYLREFALFGGGADCTATLGSGVMVNRKTHGVIFKTEGIELTRTLRLSF